MCGCHVYRNQGICKGNLVRRKCIKLTGARVSCFSHASVHVNEHQAVGQAFRVIPKLLVVQVRIQAAIRAAQHKTVHTCSHHVPVTCSTREVCHVNSSYPQTKAIKSH